MVKINTKKGAECIHRFMCAHESVICPNVSRPEVQGYAVSLQVL